MPFLLWDASGLVKRYSLETGTETANTLFSEVPLSSMVITTWGYLEAYAILRRRFNGGLMDKQAFAVAMKAFQAEVVAGGEFKFITISDLLIFSAASLVDAHNMNSADAAILAAYLDFQSRLPSGSGTCLLVASDKRLLRAANAEGLQTLDPEGLAPGDVPAFLSVL